MFLVHRSLLHGITGPSITPQDVFAALQSAIKLEHATIPPYLYALYSLDAGKNPQIADILQSVLVEEMLHMTLASNVLNALGGAPEIDTPNFIPTYPGPLPGGVEADLTVNLAPFSMTQLKTFLQIEAPEDPLVYRSLAANPVESHFTIGQFYTAISDAIATLGDGAFVNPPRNQVGPDLMRESVVVVNVATAQQAINTIIEQGEGTTTSPLEGGGIVDAPAHYYRFMEIQKGYQLVADTTAPGGYAYNGAPIPFDPTGVYPVATNPASSHYKPGSVQASANNNFNYTYTSLLSSLHALFNGDASQNQMNIAIGLMMSLKGQAKAMMAGIPDPAVFTGPSFEYQPVNPGISG